MRGTDDDPDAPGWDPDQTIVLDPCPGFCTAHLWTVPAKVEGVWRLDNEGGELHLEQRFQIVTGQLHAGALLSDTRCLATAMRDAAREALAAGQENHCLGL